MTLKFEPESIYDDPNNFRTSADTHPRQLTMCTAKKDDEKAKTALKQCPNFDYEDDYEEANEGMYCKHCWAIGFHSVCDNNPKRMN